MRNVFDQYSQPENRVTHALMTALEEDRKLLGLFLREIVGVRPPCRLNALSVLEQRYPGEEEPNEEELECRGIPDGWIFDSKGWCVFIESKVIAKLGTTQIERHRRTAERRGFTTITAVAIAQRLPVSFPPDVVFAEWKAVYAWLRRHGGTSKWARRTAEYLEIAEAKLIDSGQFIEGALTMFAGFPFGRDYRFTYLEGKRVLELAMDELRQRRDLRHQLKMNPRAPGRPAITGRQGAAVWDFLSLAPSGGTKGFTNHPHLTLGLLANEVEAVVTIPNAVNSAMRRNLIELGEDGFERLVAQVVKNLRPLLRKHPNATPSFRGVQRRFRSQRSVAFIDAQIDLDLRTAVAVKGSAKFQPRWLSAAYNVFVHKGGSNYQMQIGVRFRYDRCELRKANALDFVAEAWLACKPLIDLSH